MSQFVSVKKINKKEKIMPKVNGKHYPYTEAGEKAAKAAKKKQDKFKKAFEKLKGGGHITEIEAKKAKGLKGFKAAMEKQRYKGKK